MITRNINKIAILNNLCFTELAYDRINKKLGCKFSKPEIEDLVFSAIAETPVENFEKIGKNFYITNSGKNIRMTINSYTYRIITVDKLGKKQ